MEVKVTKNFVVLTAETMEDAAKLSEASVLLRQMGRDIPLLAYRVLEIPMPALKK